MLFLVNKGYKSAKIALIVCAMLLGAYGFPMVAAANEAVTLQLKWKHAFQFAGFYMALEKGYYKDAGLDVTIIEGGSSIDAVEQVLSQEHAYAVAGSGALLAYAQGKPIQAIGAVFQHSPLALLVKASSNIKHFSDLRGKRIMMQSNVQDMDAWAALYSAGLTAADFEHVPQSFDLHDLIEGNVDAFSAYITDQPHQLKLMGVPYRVLRPDAEGINFYGDILITSAHEVKNSPDVVQAMREASMLGWLDALENINEAVDLILAKYNTQHLPRQHLMFEAQASAKLIMPDLVQIGYMNVHRWQHIANAYISQGMMPENTNIQPFVYQEKPSLFNMMQENLWYFLAVVVLLVLMVSGATIIMLRQNLRLKTDKLIESKERYRRMVQFSPEPIAIHSAGIWLYANPASMRLFGAKDEHDIIGKPVMGFIHPDFHALVVSRMGKFVDGEAKDMLEEKLLKCDGSELWAEVSALSMMYKGQPSAMILLRDTTARKLAEEKSELQNKKMRGLRDILEALNRAKTVDEANQAVMQGAEQVLGCAKASLMKAGSGEKLHFAAWSGLSDVYIKAFDDCSPWLQGETDLVSLGIADVEKHQDMPDWMVEANVKEGIHALVIFPIVGKEGLLGNFIVYFDQPHALGEEELSFGNILTNDLLSTVQRIESLAQQERKLEHERLNMQAILDTAPIGIWMLNADSKVQFVNNAFSTLLGIPEQTFMAAEHYSDLFPKAVAVQCTSSDKQCFSQGELVMLQETMPCADGTEHTFDMFKSPVYDHKGEMTGLVGIAVDATSRLANEAEKESMQHQVEHTQRLESLGVLAGGIAHDFNNILTSVLANAVVAKRKMVDDQSTAKLCLGKIVQSSERAALLCKQMLDYSGKGKFVVKQLALSGLVTEVTPLVEASIHRGIRITYALEPSLPMIEADEAQLQQVVMNLVMNAAEAMGDSNGSIVLETGVKEVDGADVSGVVSEGVLREGLYVYVKVQDTGCGMSMATQEKLFEPFFTTKFTGRGLGMSAVLGIVRGHHGAIKLESEEGVGSTFTLLFPAMEQEEAVQIEEHEAIEEAPLCSGTILVIDDDDNIRDVTSVMLEDMGFATLSAVDGEDGLEVYQQHCEEITAVLLDMTMPKLDGKGCFSALKGINEDVVVVLSSGYSEQEALGDFDSKGLAGFVQKPYHPELLEEIMRRVTRC